MKPGTRRTFPTNGCSFVRLLSLTPAMQEASGQPHQGPRVTEGTLYSLSDIKYVYLPVSGKVVFSFQTKSRLCFPSPACSFYCRTPGDLLGLALLVVRWNQTGPRLSLDALLLLTLPLLLTLTKFVALPDVADSVHQLLRPLNRHAENNLYQVINLVLLRHATRRGLARSISSPHSSIAPGSR